jgi:twinkle protein
MLIKPNELNKEILKIKRENNTRKGIQVGIQCLNDMIYLDKTYLLLCTGTGGSGKSEFLDAIALNTALLHDWKWAFFSPENFPISTHVIKHIERYIGKPFWQISPEEMTSATQDLSKFFTWIQPPDEEQSIEHLLDHVLAIKEKDGLDAYILDPWNEIDHSKWGHLRDDQYLSMILTTIRKFNRKHNLLGCIVIHPKGLMRDKSGDFPVPTLSDCHGGVMWRNKADYGICLHRHDMSKNELTLYIQKIKFKHQGHIGSVELMYDKPSGRFKGKDDFDFSLPTELVPAF